MKNKIALTLIVVSSLMLGSIPAFAHHGTAIAYDGTKNVKMEGTVTEFIFKNPHIQLRFDTKDEKGNTINYTAECGGVYFWTGLGWKKNSIKPGDKITITVHPSRIGAPLGELAILEMPNGKPPVARMGLNAPVD